MIGGTRNDVIKHEWLTSIGNYKEVLIDPTSFLPLPKYTHTDKNKQMIYQGLAWHCETKHFRPEVFACFLSHHLFWREKNDK